MAAAPFPHDESDRIESLRRLEVLDTPPEAEFDALVKAASLVCGVPISLISLIDTDRQWFKANVGLPGATQTPREVAFCAHAILGDELFEVPDATRDERFKLNALVTAAPDIRFYAGAPLILSDGSHVGTLCVIDRQPKVLNDLQRQILGQLATAASQALEGRRAMLAERRLIEAEARANAALKHIFTHSRDGFALLSEALNITYVSPRFAELAGLPLAMSACYPLQHLIDHLNQRRDSEERPLDLDELKKGARTLAVSLDRPRVVELTWQASENPSLPGMLQLRDVSEQHELGRMKREFLAAAAHELRTPMTSIYGFAELMLDHEMDASRTKQLVARIHRQSGALLQITNDLLDLAHLDARRESDFDLAPLDAVEVISETVEDFNPPEGREAPRREMAGAQATCIVADRLKLRQVLSNLLSNAYKYSPQGGDVFVSATTVPDKGCLRIDVRDQGMGMTAEQLQRVSERFFRANRAGPIPGTGLGMSIVREIVTLFGGTLELTSEVGVGTTVSVVLPLHVQTATADSAPSGRSLLESGKVASN